MEKWLYPDELMKTWKINDSTLLWYVIGGLPAYDRGNHSSRLKLVEEVGEYYFKTTSPPAYFPFYDEAGSPYISALDTISNKFCVFKASELEDFAKEHGLSSFCEPEPQHDQERAPNHFIKSGESWQVGFRGEEGTIKDGENIRYVVQLLMNQGKEVHVFDLTRAVKGGFPDDSSDREALPYREMVDGELEEEGMGISKLDGGKGEQDREDRKKEKKLLAEEAKKLLGELEKAKEGRIPVEIEEAQKEYDAFMKKAGQFKDDNKTNSEKEKARVNVRNHLDRAIKRLHDARLTKLAAHLDAQLSKGANCIYAPNSEDPIEWEINF